MANSVTLTFAGDTTSLDRASKNVDKDLGAISKATDDASKHVEHAGGKLDDLGEGLEKSTGKFRGGKDVLDGFSDSMSSFGVELPGPIGNIAMLGGGLADLADGIATSGLPLLKKLWLLMEANPLIAIATAVIALGVGFYELYQHSEKFRNAVDALGRTCAMVGDKILGAFEHVFDWVKSHWGLLLSILGGPIGLAATLIIKNLDKIQAAFAKVIDWVKTAWDNTIGRLSLPSIPGTGLLGKAISHLPGFANGGSITGPAIVGERGPELFVPGTSGRIIPNNALGGSGTVYVDLTVRNEDGTVLQQIRRLARTEGGGSVQTAFGR